MIEIKGITKTYRAGSEIFKAVDNVSLSIGKGELMSIVGHSGSGKTTLLSLIGGLTRPDSGTVVIGGTDLWSISDDELSAFRNRRINFVFQFASLIPTLTALENVMLPTAFGKWDGNVAAKAEELLGMVGLGDKINNYPSQLSGGQQRRVAIARAFINDPEIVLADEPTGDLDEETEADIFQLFHRFNSEKGVTFIIVTHNKELAAKTRRQVRMVHGVMGES
ncbi:MAG: ABC transporter ATP-binding protein [Nitrospirae bacterium]|nr:ABC transporter ATP-binding protein [Nitrospirota bacterium]